jgi:DNA-directed RNA polymerase specialized sigma24 family protein
VDDAPVTPPRDSSGGSPGGRGLTTLRDCAKAGEIGIDEYYAACYKVLCPFVYRNSRRYLDKESFDAGDIVQETLTKAIQRYGKFIDRDPKDLDKPIDNVSSLLITMAKNLLTSHNPPSGESAPRGPDDRPRRPEGNPEAKKRPVSLDVLQQAGGLADRNVVAGESLAYADGEILAQARDQARRQLHKLAARARGPRACPFNMTSKTGCPHAALVFGLIAELIGLDLDLDLADRHAGERLRDLGRQLGLSSRDNELRRQLIGCFDWWSYQAFLGTIIDQPHGGGDRIRTPLVRWLTDGLRADGTWASSACPLRGAQLILATGPEEFERLLAQAGRPDVYEFLKRRAS